MYCLLCLIKYMGTSNYKIACSNFILKKLELRVLCPTFIFSSQIDKVSKSIAIYFDTKIFVVRCFD